MNSLDQYLQLYAGHRELINRGSAPVMNALRNEAAQLLHDKTLPKKGSENYETIDLNALLAPDFGLNLARLNMNVNASAPFHCGIPGITSAIFFLKNDIYTESQSARKNFPEGLYVGSLRDFCLEYPEIAGKYYGNIADIRNPLVALNTLLAQDGIVIWAKPGVKVNFPVQVISILENEAPLMAVRRFLIIAEHDSELKILICDHTQSETTDFLSLQVTETVAGENARVEICEMEESSQHTSRLSSMYVSQDAFSSVSATGVTLYNGTTRNEYHCAFRGQDAELKLSGMAIEDLDRLIDNYSVVEHSFPGCHTDELFKYVVEDKATGSFSGLIKVNRGASKTEAYQNSRNIISNDGARVYSKPRLEIYDDDVKCSHGSAIGQLDEKQIFYMRTRGLDENMARFLLKQAFMADVIDRISIPEFRLRLHSLVERRFSGASHDCSACKSNFSTNDQH